MKVNISKVAVIGLGYVGLNLSVALAESGYLVYGIEKNLELAKDLEAGRCSQEVMSPERLRKVLNTGLYIKVDPSCISDCEVVFICVPTPLDEFDRPSVAFVVEAAQTIASFLQKNQLVVLESTSFPGTTEEILLPILTRSGLVAESDFYVGFSSERVDPGNHTFGLSNTPKVIAGFSEKGISMMKEIYGRITEKLILTSKVKEAEMSKLIENSYRLINISFINEIANACSELGLDLAEILRLASTKPFGFQAFFPGPGVGGHCIPVDPVFLSHYLRQNAPKTNQTILNASIEANMKRLFWIYSQVISRKRDLEKVYGTVQLLLLGVTYKRKSSDIRESPSIKLMQKLRSEGIQFRYFDNFEASSGFRENKIGNHEELATYLANPTIVVVMQNHGEIDVELLRSKSTLILDCSHELSGPKIERI